MNIYEYQCLPLGNYVLIVIGLDAVFALSLSLTYSLILTLAARYKEIAGSLENAINDGLQTAPGMHFQSESMVSLMFSTWALSSGCQYILHLSTLPHAIPLTQFSYKPPPAFTDTCVSFHLSIQRRVCTTSKCPRFCGLVS